MADEPPSLPVGTGVSAKYKGAFCEAKIRKVVRSVKCKVLFKNGLGSYTVGDDQIKGTIRTGAVVEVRHPEKKEYSEATITKIQDCSQYTVVFDDGDITTLRRTALCLKSGKHFAESETLDQLPLTHPEHFSTPVIGGRRGRRTRIGASEASSDEDESFHQSNDFSNFKETDIGRVVCVEGGEKRKNRDNWFPGLIVAPTAQESVPIRVRDEYLVRSFKDGRYYTVPKKEIMEFTREMGAKAETNSLKTAVEKALQFLDRDELPLHWDRDLLLYGVTDPGSDSDPGEDNESSDDEPREKKDHFVAQLYKFMDENGTPINEEPVIGSKDVDLFRLYKVVHNLGGFNRVTNQNNWKNVSVKLGFGPNPVIVGMVKQSYRKYLLSFEEWPKRPGCSMQIQPRLSRSRSRIGRSNVIKDRSTSSPTIKIEKDKTADKSFPTLSETANLKETMAKPAAVKEVTPATPVPKDKPVNKKSAQHATPPIQVKVETAIKTPAREIKVETGLKLRNPKYKIVEPEPIIVKKEGSKEDNNESEAVSENIIAASKDKKKRITTKDKQKKDVPIVKGGKVDCLANTRQKRVIKERLKTTESIKGRSKASTTVIAEVEKSHPSKTKTKDEGTVMTKIKKEETTPTSAVSDEKRKGRKKKEKSEITLENYDVLPTYKTISLGDKLKVYYGPTKEAKITSYEAKVLSTKEENGETLYFVHYTGWNTRYDEWIRANRIADNLSWVAGKASKKQTQVPTPKSAKKEKKPNKSDNSKGECKAGSHKDVTGSSSCGSSLSSSKDHQSNRQGSVGRSTTPSSIASSSSRSKGPTHKRPTTRAAQTKKDDETTQEFDSDGGSELEESKMIALVHSENMDLNTLSQSKNNKHEPSSRDEILSVVGITLKEEEEEDEEQDAKSESEDLCLCVSPEKSDPVDEGLNVKVEEISGDEMDEDDNQGAEDETKEDHNNFEECTQVTTLDDSQLQEHKKDDPASISDSAVDTDLACIKCEEEEEEDEEEEYDDEDSKCRTDSENSDQGEESASDETHPEDVNAELKMEEPSSNTDLEQPSVITKEEKETAVTTSPNDTDTEDVYEFKEPEPFEFEARKSSDDKSKAVKRAITLSLDDKPSSPKIKRSQSPAGSDTAKTSTFETPTDLLKDDTSPESTPTIQTCEEAFDKICASPLRAAALDSRHIAMLEHLENYEDDDNFDDDSEDRLVISERDSDNCSNTSFDKDSEILAAEYSNSATEVNERKASPHHDAQSKEPFPKDNDDDDEEMEDEAINNVIQTVMNLETSDDSSDEETIPNEENTVVMTEVESIKVEDNESSSENQDLKKSPSNEEETKADDISGTDESPPHLVDETEDRVEAPIEIEDETKGSCVDTCPAADKIEVNETSKEDDGEMIVVLNNCETADIEEDENNIESLICEETIPGSPPSHLEVLNQIEEKRQAVGEDLFKGGCEITPSGGLNEQDATQQLVQVVRVERSPPMTPESDASSPPSPPRELELNTPLQEKKSEKEAEDDTGGLNESSSFKKESNKIPTTDSRPKKVEVKASTKRGRKSKKKNDDSSTRKKYARHSKHQGSESDDGYDVTAGGSRADSSRSRSPHPYHQNFLIPNDKLSALDVGQRIGHITQAMQDLRSTYNNYKTELASIDKRRKRIRRREREVAARLVNARSH